MDYSIWHEMITWCQRVLLWFLITVIFTSRELRDEACQHLYAGVVRIPGVYYGFNLARGYSAIGQLFPACCRRVRLDYILGCLKMLLLLACAAGLLCLAIQYRTGIGG